MKFLDDLFFAPGSSVEKLDCEFFTSLPVSNGRIKRKQYSVGHFAWRDELQSLTLCY